MTDLPDNGNGVGLEQPPEVRKEIQAVARARVTEAMLVIVVCVASLGLIATTAWNTYRLQNFSQQQVKAQDFGLRAINCILDNFAEHRWSNQAFHDSLGDFLKAPKTPHTPIPNLPSEGEFAHDCAPFNKGKTVVSTPTTR
jgi:hypothetical protein